MLDNFKAPAQKKRIYPPLPADVYQFEITDIKETMKPSFNDPEVTEPALKFTLRCLEDGPNYGAHQWVEPTIKLSGGAKPSKMYSFLSVVLGREFTKEECNKQEEVLTRDLFLSLLGAQVRLTLSVVKKDGDAVGKNKIEGFLPVKTQLPEFDPDKVKKTEPMDIYEQQRYAEAQKAAEVPPAEVSATEQAPF